MRVESVFALTHNIERDKVAAVRLCADLTLVVPSVPLLGPLDLQSPLFVLAVMDGLEPLVTGVSVATHGQNVDVPVTNPRHLQSTKIED